MSPYILGLQLLLQLEPEIAQFIDLAGVQTLAKTPEEIKALQDIRNKAIADAEGAKKL